MEKYIKTLNKNKPLQFRGLQKAMTKGKYKLFVKDFSNAGAGTKLTASKPVIKVYSGTTLKDTIKMTAKKGGVWYVGDYNGETGKFTVVDEASNEEPNECVKAKIGTVFNKLTQFEIEDAENMFYNWANDPEVTKYLTWPTHADVENTKLILKYFIENIQIPN